MYPKLFYVGLLTLLLPLIEGGKGNPNLVINMDIDLSHLFFPSAANLVVCLSSYKALNFTGGSCEKSLKIVITIIISKFQRLFTTTSLYFEGAMLGLAID